MTYQSDLAESLQALGHEVTVLTGFPNWPTGRLAPGYKIRPYQREVLGGIPILRVPLFPDHSRSSMRRTMNYASFAISAAALGPVLAPRCDVIHCNFPPVSLGPPAWLLSRWLRAPLTFEIQDMWPETLAATEMVNSRLALRLVDRAAKWGYRRAAAIRVITQGFRDNLLAKGVPAEKIHVISNWVDVERYRPEEPDEALARDLGLAGRFNVMFAGTIGLCQGLDAILEAAALLADLPAVQLVFAGDGVDLARLKSLAAERGLANVRFLGWVPAERMAKLYAMSDVLLFTLRDSPVFQITIPHKVFAYMASAKPVLAAVEGDAASVVLGAKAGLQCPPNQPQAMANAIRQFHAMSAQQRRTMGENGRRAVVEQYGRQRLVGQVADMLQAAVNERKRRL
jgi:glycosyltransferase involved in cell wall biosynthesis